MKGSLTPTGTDRWRLRVYVGTNQNGSPVQVSRQFTGKRRAAETALSKFVAEVSDRERPNRETITVAALLDRWVDRLKATPYTLKGYRYTIDASLKPAFGNTRLAKVTGRDLDDLYHRWQAEGVSPATVRVRHSMLRAAFRQAVKWDLLDRAPTDRATPPSVKRQLDRLISVDDLSRLVAAAEEDDPMLGTAVALGALTGARRGELCALRWSDCDLEEGSLTIGRSLTVVDKVVSVGDTKTHQVRRIALDPVAVEVIRRRMDWQRDQADWTGGDLVAHPWLLSRRADGGAPCLPNGLTHGFTRVARRVGLPYHFHELRHFAASWMLAGGVDARTTASRLGHSTPTLTLSTYAHMTGTADRAAAAILGALMPGHGETPR